MIQANEFRIGNFLNDSNGKAVQVDIDVMKIVSYSFFDGSLAGIPLTPEIFEAAGFESIDCVNFVREINYGLEYFPDHSVFTFMSKPLCLIQYTHQLQNLYFALTGSELTFDHNQVFKNVTIEYIPKK